MGEPHFFTWDKPLPNYIVNHKAVVAAFGYWPSFYDAEVLSLSLDRKTILFDTVHNARLEIVLHAWELTQEVNEKGYFGSHKHHLIHFAFGTVEDVELSGFNHVNAIFELNFADISEKRPNRKFCAEIVSAFGMGGRFSFYNGVVLSVVSCDKDGAVS